VYSYYYGSRALCSALAVFFTFLNVCTVGRTSWTGYQPVARPLPTHRRTQTQNKRTQTSMPRVGFEPKSPVFEREKMVHALDRAATVIGQGRRGSRQQEHLQGRGAMNQETSMKQAVSSAWYLIHAGFLLGLLLDPEDGVDKFISKVDWLSPDYTALYTSRYNSIWYDQLSSFKVFHVADIIKIVVKKLIFIRKSSIQFW
jgi:hypothetical protein